MLQRLRVVASAGLALSAGAGAVAASDADLALDLYAQGRAVSLETLIREARAIRPGTLLNATLHFEETHGRYVYEIQMLAPTGEVWELEVDAETGALIEHDPLHPVDPP